MRMPTPLACGVCFTVIRPPKGRGLRGEAFPPSDGTGRACGRVEVCVGRVGEGEAPSGPGLRRPASLEGAGSVVVVIVHGPFLQLLPHLVVLVLVVGMGAVQFVAVRELAPHPLGILQVPGGGAVAEGLADLFWRLDPQVGLHLVVPGFAVAEVDDAALVGPFVCRLDPGEPQLVGDVAPDHFHHL